MANALGAELEGKLIRVEGYPIPVRATGGNGCHTFTMGTKIAVHDEVNDQRFSVRGVDVKCIVPEPD